MPYSHTVVLIEGPRFGSDIEAEISYVVHPASGDGWNEPREPAYAELVDVTLYMVTRKAHFPRNPDGTLGTMTTVMKRQPIDGPVPEWVKQVLEENEWWTDVELEEAA